MKRTITFILALLMILSLAACGEKPKAFFDNLYDLPSKFSADTLVKLNTLGTEVKKESYVNSITGEVDLDYKNVDLFGYSGSLKIYLGINSNNYSMQYVRFSWEFDKGNMKKEEVEKVYNTIVKNLNKKFGKRQEENEDSGWEDDYYNNFYISKNRGNIKVDGRIAYK